MVPQYVSRNCGSASASVAPRTYMRRILAGIRAMISGVRPTVFGSSAGSPSGSEPSGSRRAARGPWGGWALVRDVAAWAAWGIAPSGPPGGAGGGPRGDGLEHRLVGHAGRRGGRPRRGGRGGRGGGRRGRPELDAQRGEDAVVEAVLAVEIGLDQLEEASRLRPLDDPVVVRRGHGHDLLGADHVADVAQADRVADRARRDDRALADHEPRDRRDRAEAARVRQRDVPAGEVVGAERVRAGLVDERVVGSLEVAEVLAAGVADDRHHQRAAAVLLLDVDRDSEVHAVVVDAVRLAVDL